MRVCPDSNVLLRAFIDSNHENEQTQALQARATLSKASVIYITVPSLCEFAWVTRRTYKYPRLKTASVIERLSQSEKVVCDLSLVEVGIAHLRAGGDFADGVISAEGFRMGADMFVSFDQHALKVVNTSGHQGSEPYEID